MSYNNSQPYSRRPYPQGCLLTRQQWMTTEDNRIAALKKKHRHSLSGPLLEPSTVQYMPYQPSVIHTMPYQIPVPQSMPMPQSAFIPQPWRNNTMKPLTNMFFSDNASSKPPSARPPFFDCTNTIEMPLNHRVVTEKEASIQREVQQCLAAGKTSFNFYSKAQSMTDIEPVVLDKTNNNYASFEPFPQLKVDIEMSSPVKKKRAVDPNNRADSQSCTKPRVHDEMSYTFHKMLSNGWQRFKCSCFRAKDVAGLCNAYLKVLPKDDEDHIVRGGNHAPACLKHNSHKVLVNAEIVDKAQDVQDAMYQFVEERCTSIDHRSDSLEVIWNDTCKHFREIAGKNYIGMTKSQVRKLVYNAGDRCFGGDVISKVEAQYSGSNKTAFLRHHASFADDEGMQRIMCFSVPQLLALLNYPMVQLFVDCTFNIVPHPFKQCLIIMIFDAGRRIYTPVAWALMTGKTNECYWQVFNWITSVVQDLDPSYIGVDFELAFFTNVSIHFPDAKLIGCLFHFKQAIRTKMKKLKFPDKEVDYAMRRGVIDLLTVIPIKHLKMGIEFVARMIQTHVAELHGDDSPEYIDAEKRWNYFWDTYFNFWMQDGFLKVWNISGIADDGRRVKLVNKTSNALRKEVDRVLVRMENIDKGREDPPEYAVPIFPEIPSEFWEMIESHKEMRDEQVKGVAKKKGRGRKAMK
eukprot:CCRYP_009698-RA/>CCRYP_009698-RA protein AED:0.16 eAED:0.16 QI:838/1/1/1/0/0/5/278/686